ncbi:MAG: hypothetical protein DRP58_10110 [Spirochaetes bacterium]|nr:MAG: hypothetical protein DRP58_10110 [Spirochaetota bacterium]
MFKLRDYQQEIVDSTVTAFTTADKVLVKSPTASGKSIMSLEVMRTFIDDGKSILIIAPQKELIEQLQATYSSLGNINLIQGKNHYNNDLLLNIGTLQTIYRRDIKHTPDLIVIDEAHYGYQGKMLKQIFSMFQGTKFFFMSATPHNTDGKLLDGFDKVIDLYSTQDLIDKGYLVDVEVYAPVVPNLRGIKIQAGDYVNSQLDEKFNKSEIITDIVAKTSKFIGSKQAIVYGINISHAENLALSYKEAGFNTAIVSSKTPTIERTRLINAFKNNEIQILTNVDILTTGVDIPAIECIVLARATKSQNLYKQIVGRGLRTSNNKTNCIVLDCAGVVKDLGYPTEPIKYKPKRARKNTPVPCTECESDDTKLIDVVFEDKNVYKIYKCRNCTEKFKVIDDAQTHLCVDCGFVSLNRGKGSVTKFSDHYELTSSCLNCGAESVYRTIDITDKELQKIHKQIDKHIKALMVNLISKSDVSDVQFIVEECDRLGKADATIIQRIGKNIISGNHLFEYITVDNLTSKVDEAIADKEIEDAKATTNTTLMKQLTDSGISHPEATLIVDGSIGINRAVELDVVDLLIRNKVFQNSVLTFLRSKVRRSMRKNVTKDINSLDKSIDKAKLITLLITGIDVIADAPKMYNRSDRFQIAYLKIMEVYEPKLSGGFNLSTLGFKINKSKYLLETI